ncbi:hypothetical protein TNCV_415871 [Trichonephila clavipes]|nr:hypothetical protein TNCV_415871 [Trichonephila clavipes]
MPSCSSVHDLELVVQELWAYLPQDNIRPSGRVVAYRASTPQTDHLIETSAYAPQRPMVPYIGMGTVGLDPQGLLRH